MQMWTQSESERSQHANVIFVLNRAKTISYYIILYYVCLGILSMNEPSPHKIDSCVSIILNAIVANFVVSSLFRYVFAASFQVVFFFITFQAIVISNLAFSIDEIIVAFKHIT